MKELDYYLIWIDVSVVFFAVFTFGVILGKFYEKQSIAKEEVLRGLSSLFVLLIALSCVITLTVSRYLFGENYHKRILIIPYFVIFVIKFCFSFIMSNRILTERSEYNERKSKKNNE